MRKTVIVSTLALAAVFAFTGVTAAASVQDQWATSKHNIKNIDLSAEDAPAKRDNCLVCHDGQGFAANKAKRAELPTAAQAQPNSIDCGVCHSGHGKDLMTSGSTAKLSNGLAIKGAGTGALCISCHNGRKLPDAAKKPAPHRSPQFDVLYAVGATTPGEAYGSSPHGANPDTCVSCHMAKLDGVANHTFKVVDKPAYVKEACGSCHAGLTTVNRTALADYDGDKVVEGIQDEVEGLMKLVEQAAEEKEKSLGATFGESHGAFVWTDAAKTAVKVPDGLYYARFNLALVEEDGSKGVHNPGFVVRLLQGSYKLITGQDVPGAALR